MDNLTKFQHLLNEQIAIGDQYVQQTSMASSQLYNDPYDTAMLKAKAALGAEAQAINSSETRSTWRDVKSRSRLKDKVFDVQHRTMDTALNPQKAFYDKGSHRNTTTALMNGL